MTSVRKVETVSPKMIATPRGRQKSALSAPTTKWNSRQSKSMPVASGRTPEHRRCRGEQDGTQPGPPGLDQGLVQGQPCPLQVLHEVEQHDGILHHDARQRHDTDTRHDDAERRVA